MSNTIYFSNVENEENDYGEFSNFYKVSIIIDNKVWTSVESYYQAQKFIDPELKEKIRLIQDPKEIVNVINDFTLLIRKDWENIKKDVIKRCLYEKFTQHSELKELLLSTNNKHLVEKCYNSKTKKCVLLEELRLVLKYIIKHKRRRSV